MSVSLNQVKQDMASLSLSAASLRLDDLLTEAQVRELTYQEFLYQLLRHEVSSREARQLEKQLKWAALPEYKTLEQFDLAEQRSLSKRQLNQLKELH